MKSRIILASVLLAVLGLAGCAGTGGEPVAETPTGSNASSPSVVPPRISPTTPVPSWAEPTTPVPTPEDDGTVAFGKTYTWENGLSVTVSAPKSASRGDGFGGETFKHFVAFTITVVNKTGAAYDPSSIYTSLQSNDIEGDEVFGSGYNGAPETKVLNNRQVKYKVKYGLSNPLDIVLELTPEIGYDSAIWKS